MRLNTESEQFSITAGIGFDSCSFTLRGDRRLLTSWFDAGLVRDIVWRAPRGHVIWEGFVESMTLSEGSRSRSKSVTPLGNRILYIYAKKDTSTDPPGTGAYATITENNLDSQESYGIKTVVISAGDVTDTEAAQEAITKRVTLSRIKVGQSTVTGGGSPPLLRVSCKGYAHMANWSPYNDEVSSGDGNASDLVKAIIAADPNGILSTDDVDIVTNTSQMAQYFRDAQPGWSAIQMIAARGDADGDEWVAGVYEDRHVIYKQAETIDDNFNPHSDNSYLTLYKNPEDPGDRYYDQAGREIEPWDMRPDRLVYTLGQDPQPRYVDQIVFTAPYSVRVVSSPINPLRNVVTI